MGGDHAPAAIVAGAVTAYRQDGIGVVLVGRPGQVRPLLAKHGVIGEVRLVAAEDSVAMAEGALASWRRPRSSIAVACQLVHLGQATAVVSAGSTAAVVSIARLRLRNLAGVLRPAIAVALPTQPTPTVLVDAGAIVDPRPEMLAQFAQLGSAYAEVVFGIASPRVGLLSIGAEPGKGNKLTRRAYELLSAEPAHGAAPVNFAGNVEGCDLLAGKVDVIVTDGFTGNVALKTVEGTAAFTAAQFRSALGAWLLDRARCRGGLPSGRRPGPWPDDGRADQGAARPAPAGLSPAPAVTRIRRADQGVVPAPPGRPGGAGTAALTHCANGLPALDRLKHDRSAGRAGGGRERRAHR